MPCKHQWKGTNEGVACMICGEKMTAEEYAASFAHKASKKKKKEETDN